MKIWATVWLVAAVAVNAIFVFASWYALQPHGSDEPLWYSLVLVFPLVVAVLVVPVSLLTMLFPPARRVARFVFVAAGLWTLSGVVAIRAADRVRMSGMRQLADRSMPLVHAIERYARETGHPPTKLEDLVPKYLPHVPTTGIAAYPEYSLVTGQAAAEYANNPWVLMVQTPSGGINFDVLAYFPQQNYPEVGHGGWWERVGAWAYLHE
jgi:hypothetical protein